MMIGRHRIDGDLMLRFMAEGMTKGAALVMAILLARWLAADGFGSYSQTQALVAVLFPIVLLGLGFAVIRQIAGASTTADIAAPVATAFVIASVVSLILAIIMWTAANSIAIHFYDHPAAPALVRAAAVLLPIAAWQSLLFEALRARRRVRSATLLQIAESAASLAAVFILAVRDDLTPVAAISVIAAIKFAFFLGAGADFVLSQRIRPAQFAILPLAGIRAALGLGVPFMIAGLGEALMGLVDRVLVGSMAGADTVGRYVAAQTLIAILASWGAPYWWLLYPRIARAFANDSPSEALAATHRLFGNFIAWGTPLAVLLAILGAQILTLAVGETFRISTTTMSVLVLAVFVNQSATPWEYYLYISGKAIFLMWTSLAWGIVAVAGIVILLPEIGLLGTAISVATARTGFALSVVLKAGQQGLGAQLLPPRVTQRSAIALAAGIGVLALMYLAVNPLSLQPWHLAGAFLVSYLAASGITAFLQARWRTA
jgi:O-antigen/teichoic acid export membrane protein